MGKFIVKDSILIQAWALYKINGDYYIEYTNAVYLISGVLLF